MTDLEIFQNILNILAVSVIFFAGLMLVMVFFFGLSMKTFISNKKGLLSLAFLTIGLPVAITSFDSQTPSISKAQATKIIQRYEEIPLGQQEFIVSMQTNKNVVLYLRYKENNAWIPLLPQYSLEPRKDHSFIVDKDILRQKSVEVVVNNKMIPLSKISQ